MAKKNNTQNKKPSFLQRVKFIAANPTLRFMLGLLMGAVAIFLCSSFLSFFSSGGADQSTIDAAAAAAADADASVQNTSGRGGAIVADYLVNGCFGWSSVLLIPLFVGAMLRLMDIYRPNLLKWFFMAVFGIVWGSVFFAFVLGSLFEGSFMSPGGRHGETVAAWLQAQIGVVGVVLVLALTLIAFMTYVTRDTITWLQKLFSFSFVPKPNTPVEGEDDAEDEDDATAVEEEPAPKVIEFEGEDAADKSPEYSAEGDDFSVDVAADEDAEDDEAVEPAGDEPADEDDAAAAFDKMSAKIAAEAGGNELTMEVESAEGDDDMGGKMLRPINPKDELSYYKPPTIDLLDKYEQAAQSIDMNEQQANKNKIVEVLRNFDIEISSIKATVGPTITLYEITPAPGVRIGKIKNLEDDIAMSLAALCIRIIAPIPGKGTVGIEVPNAHKQIVPMASLLNSRKYKETDMALPLALGKTISNEVFMVDMAKMPHLLVAGATGMGKSVGLNAIITSLLYKMHPAYLKFVMVDPKMVELSLYNVLEKHFLAKLEGEDEPIITDVNKVVRTLKSLCVEMDSRYRLLQMAMVRSVKEYNEKFLNKELLPTKGHRFMPYIVVIIDEYGDLMMTAGREVEQPIARIAQKARAVGIHMIIATQRPTTNIITGTIKANFPARMAFRVISVIDSRTILDRQGANQLQGRGDMLFLAGNDPVRVQCALVETKEVERVCAHIAKQQGYPTAYILPEPDEAPADGGGGARGELSSDKLDPLFAEAARIVVIHQQGSTSLIQRKLNVGFNRAGRIMDQLCQTGLVGEQEGSKPRQVLCADEADLEFRLKQLMH
ncbi:MAG: DNA translocase FtsK 4TM domain-containing protein [Bacteroidaceae bacterium]|nr:DNA translocase FtsK 4TM domain-containing protein [Bacteroidaceae bacterium]